jgi:hypothetical protein
MATAFGKKRKSLECAVSMFAPDHIVTSTWHPTEHAIIQYHQKSTADYLIQPIQKNSSHPDSDQQPSKLLNPTAGDCARPHGEAGPHRRGRPGRPEARDDPSTADNDRQRRLGKAVFGADVAHSQRAQRRADGAAVPGAQPAAGQAQGVETATPVLPRPHHLSRLASGEASGLNLLQFLCRHQLKILISHPDYWLGLASDEPFNCRMVSFNSIYCPRIQSLGRPSL